MGMTEDNNRTLNYYDANASQFVSGTLDVDFTEVQDKFLSYLPAKASILDFGCGSGRDTKYFLSKGYDVDATDGSSELCKLASELTGIQVKKMLFQELEEDSKYDGIWACSSILHSRKDELKEVLQKMCQAVKDDGIIYTSFKYGDVEGFRNERYFTDFTLETFEKFISDIQNLVIEEYWISGDVRPGRSEEKWLNLILRKQ